MKTRRWSELTVLGAVVLFCLVLQAGAVGAEERKEMMPGQMMGAGMMPGGMMAPGMMQGGMMGPQMMGQGMMGGGMMGPAGMPCMMGQGPEGMMRACDKGCLSMAGGMMMGQLDMGMMRQALNLTDDQEQKLRALQRPMQKAAIASLAALKTAQLDLADLLAADKVDLGKVEALLKEMEAERTKMILAQIKSTQEVKSILTREQLEKFQGFCRMGRAAEPPAAGEAPPQQGTPEHQQHHP